MFINTIYVLCLCRIKELQTFSNKQQNLNISEDGCASCCQHWLSVSALSFLGQWHFGLGLKVWFCLVVLSCPLDLDRVFTSLFQIGSGVLYL